MPSRKSRIESNAFVLLVQTCLPFDLLLQANCRTVSIHRHWVISEKVYGYLQPYLRVIGERSQRCSLNARLIVIA